MKYFSTKLTNRIKVYAYDGRIFIKRTPKKYDVIVLDAYNADFIPFHLMTKEFLVEVKGKLKNGGVVCQNVWTTHRLMKRILMTFKSVFKYVYISRGFKSNNAVILASDSKPDLSSFCLSFSRNSGSSFFFSPKLKPFKTC